MPISAGLRRRVFPADGHVAQLDRASDSGSECRGFESLHARIIFVPIASSLWKSIALGVNPAQSLPGWTILWFCAMDSTGHPRFSAGFINRLFDGQSHVGRLALVPTVIGFAGLARETFA